MEKKWRKGKRENRNRKRERKRETEKARARKREKEEVEREKDNAGSSRAGKSIILRCKATASALGNCSARERS